MGAFDLIKKVGKVIVDEINTPESFKKGEKFEKFTRDVIFPEDRYILKKMTHNYSQNKDDYVEDSLEPDYKFECKETRQAFWVESKFRSYVQDDGKVQFCNPKQLKRYGDINKSDKVFICLGIGEDPSAPDFVFVIPLDDIKSVNLYESFLENYIVPNNSLISSKKLWSLIKGNSKNHPNQDSEKQAKKGFCIRCKTGIALDTAHPLCKKCFSEWNKFKNVEYKEKFCHSCGSSNDSTMVKPVCYSCYKKYYS